MGVNCINSNNLGIGKIFENSVAQLFFHTYSIFINAEVDSDKITYSSLQKFLNKIKYFLTISKKMLILNALYKQYGPNIRPNETLGLIFDPYCLISSIRFC